MLALPTFEAFLMLGMAGVIGFLFGYLHRK